MKDSKYEEALERARQGLPIDKIFPELNESEDERTRKELIVFICEFAPEHLKAEFVSYLERQKEQKPVEPSNDELQRHQDELYNFKVFAAKQAREHHISFVHDFEWNNFCAELLSYFNKKQQPAEWSEEDEEMLDAMVDIVANSLYEQLCPRDKMLCWLKYLRPQPHWKPSKEQMVALKDVVETYRVRHNVSVGGDSTFMKIESLYSDLQKLL